MNLKAYHLQTWRVSGLNNDMTPKVEDITVKLVGELSFEKYCKFLTIRGYMLKKPPQIVKVLERVKNEWKELGEKEISEDQERVDLLLNAPKLSEKVDYESKFEDQKKQNKALEARLKALENKPKPGPKKKLEPKLENNE